jgi:hypothetical protein
VLGFSGSQNDVKEQMSFSFQRQAVKTLALERLRMPITVLVNYSTGSVEEIRSQDVMAYISREQWIVPNANWLIRLRMVLECLQRMKKQHEREQSVLQDLITEVLSESRRLSDSDLAAIVAQVPPPPPRPPPPPPPPPPPINGGNPNDPDWIDDADWLTDDVPF